MNKQEVTEHIENALRCERMRQEILLCVKANGNEVTGDFWFMLAFRTESELAAICQELHINVDETEAAK